MSVPDEKVITKSGVEVFFRTGEVRFPTVFQSDLGRYFLGRTGILDIPPRHEVLAKLDNPINSTERVFVVAVTATSNLGRRLFFAFDVATSIPILSSNKVANAHRGLPEKPYARLDYVVSPKVPLRRGFDVFERLLEADQTLVVEQEGRLILEPGHNVAFFFPAVEEPDQLDIASGWWEELV
jgi:hypothetical protein